VITAKQNVLVTLKLRLPSMTKVLRKIGDFVQRNPDKVIFMSINEVANASDASVASVMRLCNDLDFASFASFKLAMAYELAIQASEEATKNQSVAQVGHSEQLVNSLCELIRVNVELIESSGLKEIAQRIIDARLIILHGVGASYFSANFLMFKLTRLGITTHLSTDHHMTSMVAHAAGPGDLLLLFSSSGSTRESIELAKLAKTTSLPTIAFTNKFKSPLGDVSDEQLVTMGPESPLSSGSLESKCGQLLIVELLFDTICSISELHSRRIRDAADAVANKQY
jgi:RpiR family carbohydrate utilization transcriptional regulator